MVMLTYFGGCFLQVCDTFFDFFFFFKILCTTRKENVFWGFGSVRERGIFLWGRGDLHSSWIIIIIIVNYRYHHLGQQVVCAFRAV